MPDSKKNRDLLMPQFGSATTPRFCSSGAVALAEDFLSVDPEQGSAACASDAPSVFEPRPVLTQLSQCKLAASRVSEKKRSGETPRSARRNPNSSEVNS